jgi:outer membrane phospholipase A
MKRHEWGAVAALALGVVIVASVLCSTARAGDAVRFRQHLPMYVSTNYSDSDDWSDENAPYLKAQASMAASILRSPVVIGPVSVDPELAFTWRAVNWPVGAESSPIMENNYLPEAFIRVNEDEAGWFRGGRIGWLHNSTGTGGAPDSTDPSGSIDRVLLESKFAHTLTVGEKPLYITGYVRGWYTISTGAETVGIEDYINFAAWEDAGGEVMVAIETDAIRAVVTLGLSYQQYEAYIPFYAAYDLSFFGQLHHGNADGLLDYEDRHTSGGVGIALLR